MITRFLIAILLITPWIVQLNAQYASQDSVTMSSSEMDFERILLDGKTAYIEKSTKKIYTSAEYQKLVHNDTTEYFEVVPGENWDTSQVNAYKGYALKKPFPLYFEDTSYRPPVDHNMHITSRFGRRRRGPHRGIDIDLEVGDTVRTIFGGTVRFVGYSRGHGKTVVVRHENDLETVYAHLSEYIVNTNDVVTKGEPLGLGGATGNARGSHLHMEIRHKGVCINPEYLMNFTDPKIHNDTLWVTHGLTDPLRHSSYQKSRYEVLNSYAEAENYDERARRVYVVRPGDTLWGIARKNGMNVNDLIKMNQNRVSRQSTLRIGQHLVISP